MIPKTFRKAQFCDVCHRMIWGLSKQGLQCQDCGAVCHYRCADNLAHCNSPKFLLVDEASRKSVDSFETLASIESLPVGASTALNSPLQRRRTLTQSMILRTGTDTFMTKNKVAPSLSVDRNPLQSFISVAAQKSVSKTPPMGMPKLNVFTTLPRNFRHFVQKSGPVAHFQDAVEDLILWKVPSASLMTVVVLTVMCLNPLLILLVPQFVVLYVIWCNYYANEVQRQKRILKNKSPLLTVRKKASFTPEEISYKNNMQFIQNTMGTYTIVYDFICSLNVHLNWSNPSETKSVIYGTLASMVGLLFAYQYIKWNYIMLVGVWLMFSVNTQLFQSMIGYAEALINAKKNSPDSGVLKFSKK